MLLVKKFGGSSVADTQRIRRVAARVKKSVDDGARVVVVCSAMGDTTDDLIALAHRLTPRPSKREMDMLLSTGEQVSVSLLSMALQTAGCPAVSMTGAQAGIATDGVYGRARITKINPERVRRELDAGRVVVIAGFQGLAPDADVTTLGRGGSDTTAVALAASLEADFCEIYTDVDGVYTADPRLVSDARKLDRISHDEMLELASLGAVILHPRAVELAKLYGVSLVVRSSFNHRPGTVIKEVSQLEQTAVVSGIAHDTNVAKIGLFDVKDKPGVASLIFSALAAENINVDMIIQGAMRGGRNDIAFTTSRDDLPKALEVIDGIREEVGAEGVSYAEPLAKVSIVGAGMVSFPGVAAEMFRALSDQGINIDMISTSEIKVSCVVSLDNVEPAVRALHDRFRLYEPLSSVGAATDDS